MTNFKAMTADIVSAYVSNHQVPSEDLAGLIAQTHFALTHALQEPTVSSSTVAQASRAEIRKSIRPDGLISFEDGKTYKTLKRHLLSRGLTADSYREKWGLPADYPMVCAEYSKRRSEHAQAIGLGKTVRAQGEAGQSR